MGGVDVTKLCDDALAHLHKSIGNRWRQPARSSSDREAGRYDGQGRSILRHSLVGGLRSAVGSFASISDCVDQPAVDVAVSGTPQHAV